ncbi:MAG TPA: glycosyltransferase [Pseudomonadaceae bacterium]|nr:glycosyltransferase [Pseudomonadaceae bacterium]
MNSAPCLQLFARVPVPGKVKTRLIPALGAEGACALHEQLLADRLALLRDCEQELGMASELWVDTAERHPLLNQVEFPVHVQQGETLGERMYHAMDTAVRLGARRQVLLIGSDCPALDVDCIEQALERLRGGCQVVIVPALDGGYVLIGLAPRVIADFSDLFRDIPWGSAEVLAETMHRVTEAGLACALLPALPDIDRPEDLQHLQTG